MKTESRLKLEVMQSCANEVLHSWRHKYIFMGTYQGKWEYGGGGGAVEGVTHLKANVFVAGQQMLQTVDWKLQFMN